MPTETALDRLLSSTDEEETIRSNDFLTSMSNTALQHLANKVNKVEKVELEEEPEEELEEEIPVIIEEVKKEETKKVNKKQEGTKVKKSMDSKYETFVRSLSLELLRECRKNGTRVYGFTSDQMDVLWEYIFEIFEKETNK